MENIKEGIEESILESQQGMLDMEQKLKTQQEKWSKISAREQCETGHILFDKVICSYLPTLKPYMVMPGFEMEYESANNRYWFTFKKDENIYGYVAIWEGFDDKQVEKDKLKIKLYWADEVGATLDVEVIDYCLTFNPMADTEFIMNEFKKLCDKNLMNKDYVRKYNVKLKGGVEMEIKSAEDKEQKFYLNIYENNGRKLYYEVITMTEAQAIKKLHSLMLKYTEDLETVYGTVTDESERKVYDELASYKLGTETNIDIEQPAEESVPTETEAPAPAVGNETVQVSETAPALEVK